jgi:hypothetical protein
LSPGLEEGITSICKDKLGIVWVVNPKHLARDKVISTLRKNNYTFKLIAYLLDLGSASVFRIYWNHYERVRKIEEATCDICGKYDPKDVGWKDGLYNICSECYANIQEIKKINNTNRYRVIKAEVWDLLEDHGYSKNEKEKLIYEKGWHYKTPVSEIRKYLNEELKTLVNKEK